MLPEPNRVRRLRRPRGAGATARSASLVSIAGLLAAAGALVPATSAVAAEPADGEISVSVALASGTAVNGNAPDPAGAVLLQVELRNGTDRAIDAGTVRVFGASSALSDPTVLDDWLDERESAPDHGSELGTAATHIILPGDSTTVAVSVPVTALDPGIDAVTPIGLAAEFSTDGPVVADGHGAAVWNEGAQPGVGVATVVALTAPATADGLIPADELAELTSPTGSLTRQLGAVTGRAVAVGIDPRLIASVLVLGAEAPPEATEWLERLRTLTNETFPLAYADADLALEAQLGIDAPLQPLGFADATAASMLAEVTATPTPEPTTGPTAAPTAGPTAGAAAGAHAAPKSDEPVAPATEEPVAEDSLDPVADALAAWPFTRTDVAWPGAGASVRGDAGFYAAGGLTTTIRSSTALATTADVAAAATVEGGRSLVADGDLSADYRAAAEAGSDAQYRAAVSRAAARLAAIATSGAASGPVLVSLERNPDASVRTAAAIAELGALPWTTSVGLDAAGAGAAPARELSSSVADTRVDTAARMLRSETAVEEFASVLDEPAFLVAPERRDLLGAFAVDVAAAPTGWAGASGEFLESAQATLAAVHVVPSADVFLISSEIGFPTEVENLLPYPVTVEVSATPNNGRLLIEDTVELTVEANSRGTAQIPVAAGIGNGEARVTVRLESPTGVAIGQPVVVQANVHADWEGIGAIVLAVGAVAFLAFGVYRSFRRRRGEQTPDPDMPETESSTSEVMPDQESSSDAAPAGAPAASAPDDAGDEEPRG